MISYEAARKSIEMEARSRTASYPVESLALSECNYRYSAVGVVARDQNPRFNNSAMDGFALCAADSRHATPENPVRLTISGRVAAGEQFRIKQREEPSCVEVMTGSMLPGDGVDAVVRLEDVTIDGGSSANREAITLRAPVLPGENIRVAGEDFKTGEMLFTKGTRILPQHLMALAMAGYTELEVFARPRVSVISTGSELVAPSSVELALHQIRNSTAPLLCAVLEMYGAQVRYYGIVADDRKALKQAIAEVCEERPEIVITTGGVSVGRFDLVEEVLNECRARIHFHKVAVRPGKPILFGDFGPGAPVVFGLPGNPVAVATGARFFVRPYLDMLLGGAREIPERFPLVAEAKKPAGLAFFQRGIRDGQAVRVLPKGQASFMVASMLKAEGWIVGPADPGVIHQGEIVDWYPLW